MHGHGFESKPWPCMRGHGFWGGVVAVGHNAVAGGVRARRADWASTSTATTLVHTCGLQMYGHGFDVKPWPKSQTPSRPSSRRTRPNILAMGRRQSHGRAFIGRSHGPKLWPSMCGHKIRCRPSGGLYYQQVQFWGFITPRAGEVWRGLASWWCAPFLTAWRRSRWSQSDTAPRLLPQREQMTMARQQPGHGGRLLARRRTTRWSL